jgi:hypothetical protein
MTQFAPYLRTTPQRHRIGRKYGTNPNLWALLAPFVLCVGIIIFHFRRAFSQAHTALRELESAMAAETEAVSGYTTIKYEVALTEVETVVMVVMVAVDAAASAGVPEAGNSGRGYGSGGDDDDRNRDSGGGGGNDNGCGGGGGNSVRRQTTAATDCVVCGGSCGLQWQAVAAEGGVLRRRAVCGGGGMRRHEVEEK